MKLFLPYHDSRFQLKVWWSVKNLRNNWNNNYFKLFLNYYLNCTQTVESKNKKISPPLSVLNFSIQGDILNTWMFVIIRDRDFVKIENEYANALYIEKQDVFILFNIIFKTEYIPAFRTR